MSECPCGSGAESAQCCEPAINGSGPAQTAQALLRARYVAFTRGDIKFIEQTHAPATRAQLDVEGTGQWARSADWQRLEIIRVEQGGEKDTTSEIEFKAHYRLQNKDCVLHEVSEFVKKQGQWFYVDGRLPEIRQYVRETPKIGRNDPCVCGSGKKFKKCCATA